MAPKVPVEKAAFTAREAEMMATAFESTTEEIKIDFKIFAAKANFANAKSARASWWNLRKKMDRVAADAAAKRDRSPSNPNAAVNDPEPTSAADGDIQPPAPKKARKSPAAAAPMTTPAAPKKPTAAATAAALAHLVAANHAAAAAPRAPADATVTFRDDHRDPRLRGRTKKLSWFDTLVPGPADLDPETIDRDLAAMGIYVDKAKTGASEGDVAGGGGAAAPASAGVDGGAVAGAAVKEEEEEGGKVEEGDVKMEDAPAVKKKPGRKRAKKGGKKGGREGKGPGQGESDGPVTKEGTMGADGDDGVFEAESAMESEGDADTEGQA